MYRRQRDPGDFWFSGILSAILFCLLAALAGSGGSWGIASPSVVSPTPSSGSVDHSHSPFNRFLVKANRQLVLAASKPDTGPALDLDGPNPALLPSALTQLGRISEKSAVATVQHPLNGQGTSGYNARAPPALI